MRTTARLLLVLALLVPAGPAAAHKVIASVFAAGEMIEGEIGFSNGDMAARASVEVFDTQGNKLGETQTSADGTFAFRPTKAVTHIFRANLGAGHIAEARMPVEELPEIAGAEPAPAAVEADAGAQKPGAAAAAALDLETLLAEQRRMVTEAVQKQVNPLRRDIEAYKEKRDLQSILGGIGYILGIFGIGFYIAARRQKAG